MLAPSVGLLAAVAAAGPPWALVCLRRFACSALFRYARGPVPLVQRAVALIGFAP